VLGLVWQLHSRCEDGSAWPGYRREPCFTRGELVQYRWGFALCGSGRHQYPVGSIQQPRLSCRPQRPLSPAAPESQNQPPPCKPPCLRFLALGHPCPLGSANLLFANPSDASLLVSVPPATGKRHTEGREASFFFPYSETRVRAEYPPIRSGDSLLEALRKCLTENSSASPQKAPQAESLFPVSCGSPRHRTSVDTVRRKATLKIFPSGRGQRPHCLNCILHLLSELPHYKLREFF
jgi:hypothetical protein